MEKIKAPKTTTRKLLSRYSPEDLREYWVRGNGMYGGARLLTEEVDFYISPFVVRHLSNRFGWVRPIPADKRHLPFVQGILKGTVPAEYYRHIILEN